MLKSSWMKWVATATVGLALAAFSFTPARAANIAVFGDNAIDNYLGSIGHTATLVSDAQLATAGFLSGFDAFLMTRNGSSFGSGLSLAAASNVFSWVGTTGNIVLLNGDFADSIDGDANINTLLANAVNHAAASGNGFIGEFNGAVSALTANSDGFNPIGLISGSAGPLGFGSGGSGGAVNLAPAGVGHSVLSGVTLPYNPADVEFGATLSGIDPSLILATYDNGNAAIIARDGIPAPVPEPCSLALLGLGAPAVLAARRRRTRKTEA